MSVDRQRLQEPFNLAFSGEPQAPLPAVERLREELSALSPTVPVIIVVPPVFHSALPAPGRPEEARMNVCKAALAAVAAVHRRGAFIDFLADGAIARDPDNFLDHVHYRHDVAGIVEQAIGKAINGR
jgi:hypothetical protein